MKGAHRPAGVVHAYAGLTIAQAAQIGGAVATTLCGLLAAGRPMRTREAFLQESRQPRCIACAARLPENQSLDQMVEGIGR